MTEKQYKKDLRVPAALLMFASGAATVLITRSKNGDTWREFGVNAAYSIGWVLLTFGVLYLLSGRFDDWKWGREDHDLVAKVNKVLSSDDEGA